MQKMTNLTLHLDKYSQKEILIFFVKSKLLLNLGINFSAILLIVWTIFISKKEKELKLINNIFLTNIISIIENTIVHNRRLL